MVGPGSLRSGLPPRLSIFLMMAFIALFVASFATSNYLGLQTSRMSRWNSPSPTPRRRTSERLRTQQSRNREDYGYITATETDMAIEQRKAELIALMGKNFDWREYRARLVQMGREGRLSTTSSRRKKRESEKSERSGDSKPPPPMSPGRSTPANMALLRKQNPELSSERKWAHTVPTPEVGGLLLRKPMELQIWHKPEYRDALLKRLSPALQKEVIAASSRPDGMRLLMEQPSQVVTLYSVAEEYLKERMKQIYLQCQVDGSDVQLSKQDLKLLEYYQAYMDTWQQVVLITEHGSSSSPGSSRAPSRGVIINRPTPKMVANLGDNLSSSPPKSASEFLHLFDEQVVYSGNGELPSSSSRASESDSSEGRGEGHSSPFSSRRSSRDSDMGDGKEEMPSYARRLRERRERRERRREREGAGGEEQYGGFTAGSFSRKQREEMREQRRREREMRKRNGGLDITILHQHQDSTRVGATRLPGNVISSDMETARDAVVRGGADPGHFRVFHGSKKWEAGEIERELDEGVWYSVAAARSFILKHCIGLPKPLWHEVMDMVGGGLLEASELEIRKRREASSSSSSSSTSPQDD